MDNEKNSNVVLCEMFQMLIERLDKVESRFEEHEAIQYKILDSIIDISNSHDRFVQSYCCKKEFDINIIVQYYNLLRINSAEYHMSIDPKCSIKLSDFEKENDLRLTNIASIGKNSFRYMLTWKHIFHVNASLYIRIATLCEKLKKVGLTEGIVTFT